MAAAAAAAVAAAVGTAGRAAERGVAAVLQAAEGVGVEAAGGKVAKAMAGRWQVAAAAVVVVEVVVVVEAAGAPGDPRGKTAASRGAATAVELAAAAVAADTLDGRWKLLTSSLQTSRRRLTETLAGMMAGSTTTRSMTTTRLN